MRRDTKPQIEMIPTGELRPYPWNAKRHEEEQVQRIANSISAFGFKIPVIVDEDNLLIAGHGRLEAAKYLGLREVPAVRVTGLTEQQKRAYRLADNKTGDLAEWDENTLALELAGFFDVNMEDFGFTGDAIDPDAFGTDFELPDGEKPGTNTITFTLTAEQLALVEYCAQQAVDFSDMDPDADENGNGIAQIAKEYLEATE